VSTYSSSMTESMIHAYNPKYTVISPNHWNKCTKIHCHVNALSHPNVHEYDYIFIWRFDLTLHRPITQLFDNIDFTKVNVPFKEVDVRPKYAFTWTNQRIGDGFYIFPNTHIQKMLNQFIEMDARGLGNGHGLYTLTEGNSAWWDEDKSSIIHFMIDGIHDSNCRKCKNSMYTESYVSPHPPIPQVR
jgi:hypothetical protein